MLNYANIHLFTSNAAPAATASACWQKPSEGRRFDENFALARRCYR
jgi:hypothetical protein